MIADLSYQLESKISEVLRRVMMKLRSQETASQMRDGLADTVKQHFKQRFPGSVHYSPSKVTGGFTTAGDQPQASIDIDVPGVTRAYHNIDIYPKNSQALTIPLHQSAFGKKASDFTDLFVVRKTNGNSFLARKEGGNLVMMYVLKNHVFQQRDPSIMPSDSRLSDSIFNRIRNILDAR